MVAARFPWRSWRLGQIDPGSSERNFLSARGWGGFSRFRAVPGGLASQVAAESSCGSGESRKSVRRGGFRQLGVGAA